MRDVEAEAARKFWQLACPLRRRREALGLNREALAAALGVAKDTVSKWEQGVHFVLPGPRLAAVAQALQVSFDELAQELEGWRTHRDWLQQNPAAYRQLLREYQ